MLQFFRRYQRVFFIFITVAIVISFTFFGTFSTLNAPSSQAPDRVVGQGIDGSDIMQRDLETLYRFIATSPHDVQKSHEAPNLLNDSVVQKDLMATGMGMLLVRHYFEDLRPELEQRLVKIKQFRPYVHPQASQLSAEAVWQRFHPSLFQHLMALKTKSDQLTLETVALLFQLYLDQANLPPQMLQQILTYQQQQTGVSPDPLLPQADLSLFGFHSLEDWFGQNFVALAGQLICNAALLAQENGYTIRTEEVRADLFHNIFQGFQELSPQEALPPEEAEKYYHAEMRNLGGDEATSLKAWRSVMLFRRLFDDVGNSVFLDALPFKQFQAFAKNGVQVELYELPSYLQMKDLRALYRLQTYVDAVSSQRTQLELPTYFASIDQIEKRAPELVEQKFDIAYAYVDKEDLAGAISLRETWEWEVGDLQWEQLRKKFPALAQASTSAERGALLDGLPAQKRLSIDQFARRQIVEEQEEKIAAALERAESQTITQGLRSRGGALPFSGMTPAAQAALYALLQIAPVAGGPSTPEAEKIQEKLNLYSPDGRHVYRIVVLKRDPHKTVLTFAQGCNDGTLDQILDQRLEAVYPEMRRKHTALFQQKSGDWKPFVEAKEGLGRLVYADLLKAIEESYLSTHGELPGTSGDLPSVFYTQHRLFSYVRQAQQKIQKGEVEGWVIKDPSESLEEQWRLVQSTQTIERSAPLPFSKKQMFTLPPQAWSAVEIGHAGALAFFRVLGAEEVSSSAVEEIDKGHQALSIDARRSFMGELLHQISEKKAIDLKGPPHG